MPFLTILPYYLTISTASACCNPLCYLVSFLEASVKIAQPPTPHHTLPKGQPFQIQCETQRGILIDWYKDGVRIEDDAAFTINTHNRDSMNLWSSFLRSNGPPKEEDAVYKCQNRENPRDFDVIEMHMERSSSSNYAGSGIISMRFSCFFDFPK